MEDKVILKDYDEDFQGCDYYDAWIAYKCEETGNFIISVTITDKNVEWEYEPASWEGSDTMYGGGWYGGGHSVKDVSGDCDVCFIDEDIDDEISDEEVLRILPNLTPERLNKIKETAARCALEDLRYWCEDNADYNE